MSRRTLVLLLIAGGVWVVALFYFFAPKFTKVKKPQARVEVVKVEEEPVRITDITPQVIEGYVKLCSEGISAPDPFTPYPLKGGEEAMKYIVALGESRIDYIKFKGYIIDKSGSGKIFLDIDGMNVVQSPDELIDGRYMVVYVSSMGLIVLDVMKGGLYTIK